MYKRMYSILCGAISDAIDVLPLNARTFHAYLLLQKALSDAEEVMLSREEDESSREIIPFPMNKNAQDVMMGAPSEVEKKQLDDVHIAIIEE